MKFVRQMLFGASLLPGLALAQISVTVELDQEQYLAREPIIAAVRVVNLTGVPLTLGASQNWLKFDVEATDDTYVQHLADPPVVYEFTVPNAGRGTRRVDLAPYYKVDKAGRYKVVAHVRIDELAIEAVSEPAYFSIIGGAVIWEQAFGWRPVIDGEPREVSFRRYALVHAMDGRQIMLYAQVSDREGLEIYRVTKLGRYLTFSKPEAMIDRESRLHVLWQTGARVFTYVLLDTRVELQVRQTFQYTSSKPALRSTEDGTVKVLGGTRIPTAYDLPVKDETLPAPPATEVPPATGALPTLPPPTGAPPVPATE
ncbi:MAG: hypothetical protein H7A46_23840 [Verrucomicrobiales bacterium]|nr:hypothetical protein [Verrucomicrobiales bacterium]